MAYVVGGRLGVVRHHGTVAEALIGSPIIFVCNTALVSIGMSVCHGHIAGKGHRVQGVHLCVVKHEVINTGCGLRHSGSLAHRVGGAYTKIIILIPIGFRNGTDIAESTLVLGADHGLTVTGVITAVSKVAGQAAVTHGPEVLVGIGQCIDIVVGEVRTIPLLDVTVSGVVGKSDTRA